MSNLGYFVVGLGLLAGYLVAMAAVLFGAAGTLAVPMPPHRLRRLVRRCRFGRIVRRDVAHGRALTRLLREAYADGRARA